MKIEVKGNKAKCFKCNKWNEMVYNDELKINEIHCCIRIGIHERSITNDKRHKGGRNNRKSTHRGNN